MPQTHVLQGTRRWHVAIPHAQILTLKSAPLANVAVPNNPANYLVVVGPMSVLANTAAGAYTGNAAASVLQLTYGNSSGPVAANTTDFHVAIAANNPFIAVGTAQGAVANVALFAGQGLTLQLINGGSDLGGGNALNSMVVEFETLEMDASGSSF